MSLKIAAVTIDCADPKGLAEFWTKALDTTVAMDFGGEFIALAPNHEGAVSVCLQRVPEPRQGKNQLHFDFRSDDRVAEVARLIGLGATEIGEQTVPGLTWTVLADPEGNQFCVGQP